jgi:hypothetical protein
LADAFREKGPRDSKDIKNPKDIRNQKDTENRKYTKDLRKAIPKTDFDHLRFPGFVRSPTSLKSLG